MKYLSEFKIFEQVSLEYIRDYINDITLPLSDINLAICYQFNKSKDTLTGFDNIFQMFITNDFKTFFTIDEVNDIISHIISFMEFSGQELLGIKCIYKNKFVWISIDEDDIFNTKKINDIGSIVGIQLEFHILD